MTTYTHLVLPFLAVQLAAQGTAPSLRIKTDVPDVRVTIDGAEAGRTPVTLQNLRAGKITLVLTKPGFADATREADLSGGKPVSVFIVMKRLDTPLPEFPQRFLGVHEHAKSRCRGQLAVHADRLEYKASEGGDNFHIPIAAITFLSRSTGPLFVIPVGGPTGGGGAVVGAVGIERKNPGGVLPVRVETKERKYGFWVYEEGGEAAGRTDEFYQLLSRLVAKGAGSAGRATNAR